MLNKIGIGIPTRDRWDDLALTLKKLEEFGLGDCETIVMDDASQQPAPASLRARFPKVRFERSEVAQFATGARNRLATMLSKPYFLHLDNDSFPVRGDLSKAVEWLESHEKALGLALVVAESDDFDARFAALSPEPFPCSYFVGCGALLKRELFLELGGYLPLLQYYAEEVEIALKGWANGLAVYEYPGVLVRHMVSQTARDHGRRALLIVRNELLIAVVYYPLLFLLVRWPTFVLKALMFRWFPAASVIRGLMAAVSLLPKAWGLRKPLAPKNFLEWKRTPSPIKIR